MPNQGHQILVGLFLALLVAAEASTIFKKSEIAPSLALQRYLDIQETINRLAEANRAVRCRVPGTTYNKQKRYIGPARRLEELIAPFSIENHYSSMPQPSQPQLQDFYYVDC
ncbi:unnamed protein product, partial [Mesorhabditis spiculigera]